MNFVSIVLWTILLLTVSVIIFSLFAKFRLFLSFSKPQDGKMTWDVRLEFSLGLIKKTIPFKLGEKKKKEKTETDSKDIELSIINKLKKYYDTFLVVKDIWSKSKIGVRKRIMAEEISLSVAFGTGDAAHTGIATGVLWGAIYNVIGFVANFIRVTEPQIHIIPDYENELLEFDGGCILRLSVANIISVFLILYINYYFSKRKKIKKEKAAINNVNTN